MAAVGYEPTPPKRLVTMKSEDPIHIRQFCIPLEHRQTIYDWVDELLKKGAIEFLNHMDMA